MTSRLSRAVGLYRQRGVHGLFASVQSKLKTGSGDLAYQEKVAYGFAERCAQIEHAIPTNASSALDIGCNLGDMTAFCARRGLWALGIDKSSALIEAARRRHSNSAECGFILMDLGPDNVRKLPNFDVVLLLSVHHHWLRAYGPNETAEMLRNIAERTNQALVFEAPSRRVRYGQAPPDFVDNDEASVTAYHRDYLSSTIGEFFRAVEPLGKAPCVGEREPYRWSFVLHR